MILFDLINVSNGIVKGLLGKMTGFAWVVFNLVVENRVVESKAKSDGVSGFKGLCLLSGSLISCVGVLPSFFSLSPACIFSDISVVISFHFVVEDFSLNIGSFVEERRVNEIKNLIAVSVELTLNLGFVASKDANVL